MLSVIIDKILNKNCCNKNELKCGNKDWCNAGDDEVVCLHCSFGGRKPIGFELLVWHDNITSCTSKYPLKYTCCYFYLHCNVGLLPMKNVWSESIRSFWTFSNVDDSDVFPWAPPSPSFTLCDRLMASILYRDTKVGRFFWAILWVFTITLQTWKQTAALNSVTATPLSVVQDLYVQYNIFFLRAVEWSTLIGGD